MGALELGPMQKRIDSLPIPFQSVFKDYFQAAEKTEEWLSNFPKEMEWLLQKSPTDLLQKVAEMESKPFETTRIEEQKTDTVGGLILELMYRRYVAIEAIKTGEQKFQGVAKFKTDKQIIGSTINELLTTSQKATEDLLEILLASKNPEKMEIFQKNWTTGQMDKKNPLEIIQQVTDHENRHQGMLSFFDDMVSTPAETTTPTDMGKFKSQPSGWFTGFPELMTWVLDYSPAQILQKASSALVKTFTPKKPETSPSIGGFMLAHSSEVTKPQIQDYFRCIFDLIQAPFPQKEYFMARTTPIKK